MDDKILFTADATGFWNKMRSIIREETALAEQSKVALNPPAGLSSKPRYKINEICALQMV